MKLSVRLAALTDISSVSELVPGQSMWVPQVKSPRFGHKQPYESKGERKQAGATAGVPTKERWRRLGDKEQKHF